VVILLLLAGFFCGHDIHPSGAPEMQANSAPQRSYFHLLVWRKRAFMDLWLTATERNKPVETAVLMEIENLRRASMAELRKRYQEVFQDETRCTHREHLFRRIAWRLQALAEGDLSQRARGRAQQIAPRNFFAAGGERVQTTGDLYRREQDRRLPLPGTLLTRSWKGRTILVEVLAKGFLHENQQYPSLSAIATAITGTRWNGLAFFGLTRPARREGKEQPRAKK
jgi:Protein of unknown function (DUF2924)